MRSIARAAVLAALVLVGCTGASSEPAAPKSGPAPSAAAAVAVAPVPLRRLTREEYNNTVRDLLADTTRPANAFPPDETVGGFESNGMAPVTALQVERYMDAAEALSTAAVGRLEALAPCAAGQPQEQCARSFIDSFGRLAYRRPLDDAERAQLSAVYAEKAKRSGHAGGVQLVLEVILQSPQFLYRLEPADGPADKTRPLTGYELATRLSYFIWASTPDSALLEDAEAGRLSEADDVAVIARRMLKDPRAVDGIKSFHRQWLGLRELETESKDVVPLRGFHARAQGCDVGGDAALLGARRARGRRHRQDPADVEQDLRQRAPRVALWRPLARSGFRAGRATGPAALGCAHPGQRDDGALDG
jgi:hypothetical protein